MVGARTSIYNLTDVSETPQTLTLFNCPIAPGGKLILPLSKLTPVEMKRLGRMQTLKLIGVGDGPPSWYAQEMAARRRRAQSQQAGVEVEEVEETEVATLFDVDEVMGLLERRTKSIILTFSKYLRPPPTVASPMRKADLLAAIRIALESGTKIIPLNEAMDFLEG